MNHLKLFAAISIMSALSACGGSSTGGTSFASIAAQADALGDANAALLDGARYTNLASLPTTGSTRYSGQAGYIIDAAANTTPENFAEADYVSNMTATLNFQNNRLTGTAANFQSSAAGETVTGSLDLSGTLNRSADLNNFFGINGRLDGDLQSSDAGRVTVSSSLFADLYGANRQILAGGVEGTASTSQGVSSVTGAFILER